jgi:hypothetical protein
VSVMKLLQERLVAKRREMTKLALECDSLQRRLQTVVDDRAYPKTVLCDHSVCEPYDWEFDNGYGEQTMCVGTECTFCRFKDPYNRGAFFNPAELRS